MARYVIDSSVAVEYLLGTQLGLTIADVVENSDLVAPELFDIEVLSAMRGFVLRGRIAPDDALDIISVLSGLEIHRVPHKGFLLPAWHYFRNVSSYDAVYLAMAEHFDVAVITADSKLSRAPSVSVVVHDVRDANVLARIQSW